MKVAILSLYSGHIDRGVETWVREFASRMQKKHNVLVFQGSDQGGSKIKNSKTIKVRIIWKIRAGENILSQLLGLPYWIALNLSFTIRSLVPLIKFKPDIVLPTNGGIQTLIIKIFSKVFGWKVVVTGHAGIGAPDKWNILMRPDVFVSPSKRGAIWARNLFLSRGIKVDHISHGVNLKKFSPNTRKIAIKLQRPIILCVSSFDPYKRVDLAVKAVARLKRGSLLVVGGGRGKIDNMAKELLAKDRYLKLQVKPEEIPSYYVSSDLFTLPSNKHEAFAMVYLEAMASGLPIVATNDELRREIVGDAGLLVDPKDTETYARALEKALKTDWGNKPRNQAKKFSWDKVVDSYERLFNSLIK